MRLLEYECKKLVARYNIQVPRGVLLFSKQQHFDIKTPVMLKAQIPLGGRGKAGGVVEAGGPRDARKKLDGLFSNQLRGYGVTRVLAEQKVDVKEEYFMAITYDTVQKRPVAVFSTQGGMDVEELARRLPQKVAKCLFSVRTSLYPHRSRELAAEMGITGGLLNGLSRVLSGLADLFLDYDATLAEINPLAVTAEGLLVALDCHIDIDDDALFRQQEMAEIAKDRTRFQPAREQSEFERRASRIDSLDHRGVAGRMIEFDGNLGLIIGGGGASLTAFDAVKACGGRPANYCEIGGNPSVRKIKELTKLILSRPGVKKIAVIMNVVSNTRVDLVARGIIKGILEMGMEPSNTVSVFRIPGAWEEEGLKILSKYGVRYRNRNTSIDEAAQLAVENCK